VTIRATAKPFRAGVVRNRVVGRSSSDDRRLRNNVARARLLVLPARRPRFTG
jgi:hypothetical protein